MRKKNAASLIISVSGLRGEVGYTLTPDVVQCYIFAFAEFLRFQNREKGGLDGRTVLVSSDGRMSGAWIIEEVERGFRAAGVNTLYIGIAATPTLGYLVKKLRAPAGVQITASHNPNPWNGIKLFDEDGCIISASNGERVKRFYDTLREEEFIINSNYDDEEVQEKPKLPKPETFQKPHIDAILKLVDVDAIRAKRFKVFIDSNHGSGSVLASVLMRELGCELIFSDNNEKPDGKFIHTPEPTEDNLKGVGDMVVEYGADVGFCQDPDADRLAILSETGEYIGEECTLALCVKNIFLSGKMGTIVTNCSTSMMTRDITLMFGGKYEDSPVGEVNVVDKMRKVNAILGGEGNGGPIHPEVGLVRDSFLGMAFILDLMARTGMRVSELVAELPKYVISKMKVSFERDLLPSFYDMLKERYTDAEIDEQDGLKLSWMRKKKWVLIRPSNTEPIIRVIAEAKTAKDSEKLCKEIIKLAKAF